MTVLAQDHCYSVLLSITLTNLLPPRSVMMESTLSTSMRCDCLMQSRMHGRSADEQSSAARLCLAKAYGSRCCRWAMRHRSGVGGRGNATKDHLNAMHCLWRQRAITNLPGQRWATIQQLALVWSSSSLHSEACNAIGASDGVIHSRISFEVDCSRASTNTGDVACANTRCGQASASCHRGTPCCAAPSYGVSRCVAPRV